MTSVLRHNDATMTLNNHNVHSQSSSKSPTRDVTGDVTRRSMLPSAVAHIPDDLVNSFPHTKRVGNYLLGRTIGEGSFAKVKEGLHVVTGEQVGFTCLSEQCGSDSSVTNRLSDESSRVVLYFSASQHGTQVGVDLGYGTSQFLDTQY